MTGITADGRAKLLDFSAPDLANDAAVSEPPPICELRPSASQFLNLVADAALEGRMAPPPGQLPGSVRVPLPLHARKFLNRLGQLPGADEIVAALQPLMHQVAEVSRVRRVLDRVCGASRAPGRAAVPGRLGAAGAARGGGATQRRTGVAPEGLLAEMVQRFKCGLDFTETE